MSSEYKIDIRTKFIAVEQKSYILFPGDAYRFYYEMLEKETIFLDIPGFPIIADQDLSKAEDLVARLVMSERIKAWHLAGRPTDDLPVRHVEQLKEYRTTPARLQFAGQIRNFFLLLRVGDVIVVPAPNFDLDVLFGEITSVTPTFLQTGRYEDDLVPGFQVEWLAKMSRGKIPSWLARKMTSPNPLRQIEKEFHPYIFDIMYERYHYDNKFVCKFKISSDSFSALDDYLFQQIILYVSALYERNHDSSLVGIGSIPISSAAASIMANEDIPELRVQISSPGYIVVYTGNLIPLIAGALMTLAAAAGPNAALGQTSISITNSADQSQISIECQADIEREVLDDMNAMGYKRWQELCEIEVRARQRTDVNPGMGVVHTPATNDSKPKAD